MVHRRLAHRSTTTMHAQSIGTALALVWASALPLATARAGDVAASVPGYGPADTVVPLPIGQARHTVAPVQPLVWRDDAFPRPHTAPAQSDHRPRAPAAGYQPVLLPNLNLSPEQLAIAARRSQLPFAAKLECSALDTRLPQLERAFRRAKGDSKAEAEQALQQARLRFVVLRC